MSAAHFFNKRSALLEFAERSSMKPNILSALFNVVAQHVEGFAFASPHLSNLRTEDASDGNAQEIKIYNDVIHGV